MAFDIESIKKKALELKDQAQKKADELVEVSGKKLSESKLTLNNEKQLKAMVAKSKNTSFTSSETGETKTFVKRSMVIFGQKDSDFFKQALYVLPVLWTKGFSQNTPVALALNNVPWANMSDYWVEGEACLVVYENEKIKKIITGSDKILKLVKSMDLDINSLIETGD